MEVTELLYHIYRLLRCRKPSDNLPNIYKLRGFESQQHTQIGALLNSFSISRKENRLVGIYQESKRGGGWVVIGGCNILLVTN